MKVKATIQKDGKIITEVIERQEGEQCSKIKMVTGTLGRELSDENTGPECDKVEEINAG